MPRDNARGVWLRLAAPIFALVAVIAGAGFFLLADIAEDQDRSFVESSTDLVDHAIEGTMTSAVTSVLDFAIWNDAYDNITAHWNSRWVERNMYSAAVNGIVVFRADHSVRYKWTAPDYLDQENLLSREIAARALEAPAFTALAAAADTQFMSARTMMNIGGTLVAVAVAPVSREDGAERARLGRRQPTDFVATIEVVDPGKISAMGASLGLHSLQYIPGSQMPPSDPTRVTVPVRDRQSQPIGWLSWRNQHPGSLAFARRALPILLGLTCAALLAFAVTQLLVRRQMRVIALANAAQDANRLKSQFLANMSHELRTPLNAIIGYSEIIEDENAETGNPTLVDDAQRIQRAARHLLGIINDVLDHSKIESGKFELYPVATPLAPLFNDVVEAIGATAQKNGNELIAACTPGIGEAMIDPLRFKQCLLNLASNAAKFTRDGRVKLSMSATFSAGVPAIRFEVADTGIGMSEDVLERLFKPFVQASGSVTRDYGGTGLGLSITKRLAESMGGTVTVTSKVGEGSTFALIVPRGMEIQHGAAAPLRAA